MPKVSFNNKNNVFYSVLKSEVEEYFSQKHLQKTGNWKLFLKTAVLIPSAVLIYIFLFVFHLSPVFVVMLGGLLGFVLASIGFNVMHDACHGSYSRYKWVNEVFGLSLNLLGGNAFIWKQKHNIIHHTYTNIDGMDDDISFTRLLRLCPTKHWMPIHRLQHIYLFVIYSLTSIAWVFGTDFRKYFNHKVYTTPLSKMNRREHFIFWTSKSLNFLVYILLPVFLKGWLFGLLFFISLHIVLGFTLAIVFQLAHVVENTEFELAATDPKVIENEWAIHQVKTTANFAPRNKIDTCIVGGMKFHNKHQ
jgi:linoleoyl-CoA desaturase